jgi:hypothetical protein
MEHPVVLALFRVVDVLEGVDIPKKSLERGWVVLLQFDDRLGRFLW